MKSTATTLAELSSGHRAKIIEITGKNALKRRLAEMGITPGCEITAKKVAPLGDPIEIDIRGYRLVLRRADAKNIRINT